MPGARALVNLAVKPFLRLPVGFGQIDAAPEHYLVGLRRPAGFGAPAVILVGNVAGLRHRQEGDAQAQPVGWRHNGRWRRCGVATSAGGKGRCTGRGQTATVRN